MTLLEEFEALKRSPNELHARYVDYIADQNVPLDDRWAVFCAAPSDWKVHEGYIQHFDAEKLAPGGEISWYDDFFIEKYQTVDMVDWLSDIRYCGNGEDWTDEAINAFKDEVMQLNLGSFKFDW